MFSPDKWFTNPSTGFYPKTIGQSLRFEDGDSAYLSRTPASAGNQRTWTWSCWLKRGNITLGSSNHQTLFSCGTENTQIRFNASDDTLDVLFGGSTDGHLRTSQVFRDTSAFYNIVVQVDTTQSTSTDRCKVYINGTQVTSFGTSTYPAQNYDTGINNTEAHNVGRSAFDNNRYFDGYMAEVHFLDGIANDPTTLGLGEVKDGVWIPKAYSGSHGTNGFYLPFDDSSAIGDDESANTNDFTANNLAATSVMLDTPTNNFCTMNPLNVSTSGTITFAEGNLKTSFPGTNWLSSRGTIGVNSGKWYWECEFDAGNMNTIMCGIHDISVKNTTNTWLTGSVLWYNHTGGEVRANGTDTTADYGDLAAGDILGVALNMDDKQLSFYKNGSIIVTNYDIDISGIETVVPSAICQDSGNVLKWNFGQDSANVSSANADGNGIGTFEHAVPSGFLALCSSNLPDVTIGPGQDTQADDHFDTLLWTGNGTNAGDQQEINGLSFQPDWVWTKGRGGDGSNPASGQQYHELHDSVRGAGKRLFSNLESAETDVQTLKSFDSDGFTVAMGTGAQSGTNQITTTMVGWCWKVDTAFSNSAGANGASIASSGKSNSAAGISIVSYTGTGSAGTILHGLSSQSELVIVKNRDDGTKGWPVQSTLLGNEYLEFDEANGKYSGSSYFNNTAPTASVFSVGTSGSTNTTDTYISYCFHSVESYSKVGLYVGNGSTNGTFVHTGFKVAWLIYKRFDSGDSQGWIITDNKRNTFNVVNQYVSGANNNAEGSTPIADFLSNGFKLRIGGQDGNVTGGTYVYLAFAETPFKFANAR